MDNYSLTDTPGHTYLFDSVRAARYLYLALVNRCKITNSLIERFHAGLALYLLFRVLGESRANRK